MSIISLLTDFGERDGYVGTMKGVIWGIAPDVHIADITHAISPQNITEGALVLGRAWRYFPPGTIHLAVVDPGVGTQRRGMAARLGDHFYVGPDNGLITPLVLEAHQLHWQITFYHLNQPRFWLPEQSNVFHGRDIFSPVAAYLAKGTPIQEVGEPFEDPILFTMLEPAPIPNGLVGEVTQVDIFGDLSTNFTPDHLRMGEMAEIEIAGEIIRGLVHTFAEARPGELVALYDSSNHLSICEVNGSAAIRLDAATGTPVRVIFRNKAG